MLDYIVPAGQPSVVIKYKSQDQSIPAAAISGTKITDKNIAVLINAGSASASEIFA
jgi:C-terminal processing protease CtpA/Prc